MKLLKWHQINLVLLLIPMLVSGKPPDIYYHNKPPQKIIRTCCVFGVDVATVMSIAKITSITEINALNHHKYLGDKSENNGIIYTHNGGFIDLGHLRDIADYTAYLYNLIQQNRNVGLIDFKLGYEAGVKTVSFQIPSYFTNEDIAKMAGMIAYNISTWHEIATWFGASYIPLIAERYSSFSIEDAYSNLLGVQLAIKAILSTQDYEPAMSRLIRSKLLELNAVATIQETRDAMNVVKNIWWSESAKMPSRKLMLKRDFDILDSVKPWLISDDRNNNLHTTLKVPFYSSHGELINNFYKLSIKVDYRIPLKKIINENWNFEKHINQNDFPAIITFAKLQDEKFWNKQQNKKHHAAK